ncbi:hypothetical protein ACJQWK_00598 [Exserohilum turcicum]|uniref:MaoC-like domain-containing protein n=1 Tax=Exserohilum turcicum (strain 28A) TaxID=671987 RepID=R0IDY2_EXST2|nr:uncharacterized protein SETTUDRAFT_43285 [Exserohilum turcica Et28A]EOA83530.1 hypothetical protein SETTUDRAFT_43285 [Exserohilum turcica Et28A]
MMIKSLFYATTKTSRPDPTGLQLCSPLVISPEDVTRFLSAVGHQGSKAPSLGHAQLMLFLSVMTEPAMLLLISSPRCPINPLGAVNVRNTFELIRPELCDLENLMDTDSAHLEAVVRPNPTPVKRGIEWELEVNVNVPIEKNDGAVRTIFRQVFTMLEFRKMPGHVKSKGLDNSQSNVSTSIPMDASTQISLSGDDPLKWAALCKDYNFIHLSGLAAKLFGLPGKLAHGNHAAAKALWSSYSAGNTISPEHGPLRMRVEFKKPMVVPAVFDVTVNQSDSTRVEFTILRKGRVHATGDYGPLELYNS